VVFYIQGPRALSSTAFIEVNICIVHNHVALVTFIKKAFGFTELEFKKISYHNHFPTPRLLKKSLAKIKISVWNVSILFIPYIPYYFIISITVPAKRFGSHLQQKIHRNYNMEYGRSPFSLPKLKRTRKKAS
jgi:hypothetical protein